MASVTLELLTKRFRADAPPAVDAIDLEIADGELFALVGPSGCGKTTTLRMIAGLERPTRGAIRFDGRDVTALAARERNVGIVFQHYAVFPTMSVLRNVLYGLEVRRVPRTEARRRAADTLGLVGLEGYEERMPAQLSGGQLQRVALARALVIEPLILLLDEPLSNLDAKLRVQIRREIRRIQQTLRITTVHVTHDQEEALSIADRLAVMDAGRIAQIGTPHEVYRAPATPFVADFVGTATLLDGVVERIEAGRAQVRIGDARLWLADRGLAPGTPIWVSLRPEALAPATGGREETLHGRIADVEFLGRVARGELTVQGLERGIVFELPHESRLQAGSELALHVDPDRVVYGAR